MRWVEKELAAFQDTLKTTGGLTAHETVLTGVNVSGYLLLIDLRLWESKEILRIPPSTDVQITVWPVKPLFSFIMLVFSPLFIHQWNVLAWFSNNYLWLCSSDRPSKVEDLLEVSVLGIWVEEQQALAAHTDRVMIKEERGWLQNHVLLCLTKALMFFSFSFKVSSEWTHISVQQEGKRLLGRCVLWWFHPPFSQKPFLKFFLWPVSPLSEQVH